MLTCKILLICKEPKSFQNQTSQFKLKITQDVIKKEICWYGRLTITQNLSTYIYNSEAVAQKYSVKKMFLEISQNSQENTCARVSFLVNLQAETLALVLSCEFCEISKNTFFTEHLPGLAVSWVRSHVHTPTHAIFCLAVR